MNKVIQGIIAAIIAIIIGVCSIYFVYYYTTYNSLDNKIANIINEGNDFMDSGNYQAAIDKYIEAMEYEPESVELKNAISHAYVCKANSTDEIQVQMESYQNALTYDGLNTNAYWGMINIYESIPDEDNELRVLQTGYANTGDDNMRIKAENIESERARIKAEEEQRLREEEERAREEERINGYLLRVYDLFNKDDRDIDEIKELIRTEEFVSFADEIIGADDSYYYGDKDGDGRRNGKGLALYKDGYYYFGDFKNDVRSGQGIYMRAVYAESSSIGSYIFEGTFENDRPNGDGTSTSNFYKDKISSAELVKQVVKGNYTDGLENGKMNLEGTTKAGKSVKYSYTSSSGIAEKSSNEDSGIKGQYIIAKSQDGKSNLTSDGSKRGVESFLEESADTSSSVSSSETNADEVVVEEIVEEVLE